KDTSIVRGLKYDPHYCEAIVEGCDGVRKGCVAAFAGECDGHEELVVVAELKSGRVAPDARLVNQRLLQGLGITATTLVFIEARTIPKTSSGKIQRHLVRQRWLEGALRVIRQVAVSDQDTTALAA